MKVGAEVSKRFVVNTLGTFVGFLGTTYFTRALGWNGIGAYSTFLGFQMVTATLVTFGLFNTVIKLVSEGENQARHFTSGFVVIAVGFVVASVGYFAARPYINSVLSVQAAMLVPLGVLSYSLFHLTSAYLQGEGKVALAGFIENSRYVPIVVIQVVLVGFGGWGIFGLIWGVIAGQFLTFFVGYAYARVIPARPSRALFAEFVSFSKFTYVQSVASQLFKHADYILLSQFVGVGASGIYKVAFTTAEAAMLFSAALSQVSFPEFSRLTASERATRVRQLLGKNVSYAGLFALPVIGGGAVVGNALLSTIFGKAPGAVTIPLLGVVGLGNALVFLLGIANLFNGYRGTLESYFLGTNRPRIAALSSGTLLVVYAVLFYPLITAFGAIGLALTTTVSFGASCLLLWWVLEYPLPRESIADVAAQALSTVVMVAAVAAVTTLIGGAAGFLRLAVALATGGVTYFGVLVLVNERVRSDVLWVFQDLRDEYSDS